MMHRAIVAWVVALCACQHAQTACHVIDAAHRACILVRTRDERGALVETRVTPDELVGLVRARRR